MGYTLGVSAERRLSDLGIHRLPCELPFPDAGGPVNAWAIDDDDGGVALVDTGLGTPTGESTLRAGLEALGYSLADVRRVLVTHGHIDHYGLASTVVSESQAPVWVHPDDRDKLERPVERRLADVDAPPGRYLRRLGLSIEALEQLDRLHRHHLTMAPPVRPTRPLTQGARLRFRHFEAEVIHSPGHTRGLVCLYLPEERLLLSNDHLLERTSPNPLIDFDESGAKFRALPTYLRSLAATRALPVDWILPGHGPPFSGHVEVIDRLLGFFARRQEQLLGYLASGPTSALALVERLFPRARPDQLYLTVSEVVGQLEVLEERGLVRRLEREERWLWETGAPAAC